MVKDFNPVHPSYAKAPIVVTELGMTTSTRLLQLQNTCSSMLVKEFDKDTEAIFVHPLKAYFPILFTELGIVTEE